MVDYFIRVFMQLLNDILMLLNSLARTYDFQMFFNYNFLFKR